MTETTTRRLPIFLVLDVSGSMTGEPIEAVRQGVKALVSDLRGDPMALETAALSVITFSSGANQTPLADLCDFQEPVLSANGSTAMGAAITMLCDSIERDVRKGSETTRGDYRPLVFLLTDGEATDEWEGPANRLKSAKTANVIACAAGPGANAANLRKITETVVELKSLQPEALKAFFRWVSASCKVASVRAAENCAPGTGARLPDPPAHAGINLVL